jgi:16S rRNA (adenine1518-N6/adenine1519-N6)-dimethyltransferase
MSFYLKKKTKEILKRHNIKPSKKLGQNFLINSSILKKVIDYSNLNPNECVLEIGPGIGILTIELAKKVNKVIAVEKDRRFFEILKELTKSFNNIEIIFGDALKIESDIFKNVDKVVANLPFYITSPLIRRLLEGFFQKPMFLMVQKEVVQRICAKPPYMSILSISVQFFADPEILFYIPKNYFWPSPKVDSAFIKLVPRKNNSYIHNTSFRKKFFKIVKAGFIHPRKQLANNLSKGLKLKKEEVSNWLLSNNIFPAKRAQELSIQEWILLTKNMHF